MDKTQQKLSLDSLKAEVIDAGIGGTTELFVGVTKEGNLISLEFDFLRMIEHKEISICANEYDELISDETAREEAEAPLRDAQYWIDLGYLKDGNNPLLAYIDFDRAAEDIISNDGWENINGEFEEFGTIEGTTYYMNLCAWGQHEFKTSDISNWLVNESETAKVLKIWDEFHLNAELEPEIFLKLLKYLIKYVKKHKQFMNRSLVLEHTIETIKELQGYDEI